MKFRKNLIKRAPYNNFINSCDFIGSMYKAIVFDFDGVITDGIPFHDQAYIEVFGKYGIKITIEQLHKKIGLTIKEVIAQIFDEFSIKEDINKAVEDHKKILYRLYKENATIPEHLTDFLEACKRNHLKIAIASSTYSNIVEMILKKYKIDNFFNVIVGGEDITKGKPNPEMIEKALKELNIDSKYTIAIDDAKSGIIAAKKINMYTIAYNRYSQKVISEADINVNNFNEIKMDSIVGGS